MKQRVAHGSTIDTATPDEIAHIVARAFTEQAVAQYERKKGVINTDATGAGSDTLRIPSNYDWILERVTFTGVSALFQLFENQSTGSDLLEVAQLGLAGLYSDSFANRLYVGANSQLVIQCTGGPANGQVTYNLQIRLQQRMRGH